MAKVDKCETERDFAKDFFVFNFICLTPIIVIWIMSSLYNHRSVSSVYELFKAVWLDVRYISLFFIVNQVILFFIWCPYYLKRKKAMRYGVECEGKIIRTVYRKFGKFLLLKTTHYFYLVVEYNKGGQKRKFKTDMYMGSPTYYIPNTGKCKVYEYKGRPYIQEFPLLKNNPFLNTNELVIMKCEEEGKLRDANMWRQIEAQTWQQSSARNIEKNLFKTYAEKYPYEEPKRNYSDIEELFRYENKDIPDLSEAEFEQAIAERECIPPKYSNSHILTPALIITGEEKNAYVFVELKIISYIAYSYDEMGYYVDLCKYLDVNEDLYFSGREEEFISGIKQVVERKTQLLSTEKNYFKLKEVLVSIRDIKKRKIEKEVELW